MIDKEILLNIAIECINQPEGSKFFFKKFVIKNDCAELYSIKIPCINDYDDSPEGDEQFDKDNVIYEAELEKAAKQLKQEVISLLNELKSH